MAPFVEQIFFNFEVLFITFFFSLMPDFYELFKKTLLIPDHENNDFIISDAFWVNVDIQGFPSPRPHEYSILHNIRGKDFFFYYSIAQVPLLKQK